MAVTMSEQQQNSKKGFGGKRQYDIFYVFSSAFEKIQMEATRLHVQLSDGICLWFSLTFFSHWVIQNYNIQSSKFLRELYLLHVHMQLQRRVMRRALKFWKFYAKEMPLVQKEYLSLNTVVPLSHCLLLNVLMELLGVKKRPLYLCNAYKTDSWEGFFKLVSVVSVQVFIGGRIWLFKKCGMKHNHHKLLSITVLITKNQR